MADRLSDDFYFVETDGGEHERALLADLLRYYNSLERPVFNESDAVELQLGLTLQQIIDVVRLCYKLAGWSTLIGPDQERYCALIGWDIAINTQGFGCLQLCLYGLKKSFEFGLGVHHSVG